MVNPYYEHFKSFVGSGIPPDQIGDVYRSVLYQRGYGIGGNFEYSGVHGLGFADTALKLFRLAMPALKSGLQYLGKSAVTAAADVANDAIMGKNVKESAKEHVTEVARDLFAKAPDFISGIDKRIGTKRKGLSIDPLVEQEPRLRKRRKKLKNKRGGSVPALVKLYPVLEKWKHGLAN